MPDAIGRLKTALSPARRFALIAAMGCLPACGPTGNGANGPSDASLISFDRYHTVEEFDVFLEAIVGEHENLADLVEIGRSRAGRRILAVEIHNPETGPAEEKPAFYLDGNIHGGEVLAGEGALYFVNHLLTEYGRDSEITTLVDTRAFYVVPLVNPDGRAISVNTPENHRRNIRPDDEDDDGKNDEDPPEDLDGDGRILRMRVVDPDGNWQVSDEDPRLMVRRRSGDSDTTGTRFSVYTEGLDNDADGRFNEDRVGGVDLNRNLPSNWSPAQSGSGPFPLSEPETHALVKYITSHPNIAAIHTYHTSGGLLLRFPTMAYQDWEYPRSDIADYRAVAEEGVVLTGYINYAHEKQAIVDLMNPGHGVFNDWASSVFGVFAITTEMWSHPFGDGQLAGLEWNDEMLDGEGFIDWYFFDHPQLESVELGGWDRWSTSSPPEQLIAEELDRNNQWVLSFAVKLPQVAISNASVTEVDGEPGVFDIRATVANTGWMPTATAYAREVLQIARPVTVSAILANAELVEGQPPMHTLGTLPGARDGQTSQLEVSWRVRVTDTSAPANVSIEVRSEKAGISRVSCELSAGGG